MFDYIFDNLFSILIICLMFLTWLNANRMKSIAEENKKISKQMANIQENGIKIHVLPNIVKIITNLDKLTQIVYFDYDEQVKNNISIWKQLNQVIFYFNESDEIYKSIYSLYEEVWDLTGKVGERQSIIDRGKKPENRNEYVRLTNEISVQSKCLFKKITNIKKEIIKRYRIEMKTESV